MADATDSAFGSRLSPPSLCLLKAPAKNQLRLRRGERSSLPTQQYHVWLQELDTVSPTGPEARLARRGQPTGFDLEVFISQVSQNAVDNRLTGPGRETNNIAVPSSAAFESKASLMILQRKYRSRLMAPTWRLYSFMDLGVNEDRGRSICSGGRG